MLRIVKRNLPLKVIPFMVQIFSMGVEEGINAMKRMTVVSSAYGNIDENVKDKILPLLNMGVLVSLFFLPVFVWSAETGMPQSQALTDPKIAHAVENEIRADGVVPIDPIDIYVHEGVVTFKGTVSHLLAKERATRLAETVKGVRAVVNELMVVPRQSDTDNAVEQRVIEELKSDSLIDPKNLKVRVDNGIVTIEGSVQSWNEKFVTGKIVKRIQGVKGMENQLVWGHIDHRPDSEIRQEIMKRLTFDAWVPQEALDVKVNQGHVILSGTVGSAFAKRQAFQHSWTIGVQDVNAEGIEVNPELTTPMKREAKPQMSSDKIQEAVIDAILYDSRVVKFPEVDVKGGVVTLTGHVNTLQAKRAAEEDAKNTSGVWYVRNYLKVRPPEPLTDLEIENLIREAWTRNPYLTKWGIDVTVFDGTAYLAGTLGSFFQKEQAEETAARVKGVTKVLNRVRVNAPWLRKDDAEIQENVKDQLWWSPFVDDEGIVVSVENGMVTLKGTVKTWQERRIAAQNAYEGGARTVYNKLDVEYADEQDRESLSSLE
jgi:osmotically-inducible protein OsmY